MEVRLTFVTRFRKSNGKFFYDMIMQLILCQITHKNLARQDFQQRQQIVSISEILEQVPDISAGLEWGE